MARTAILLNVTSTASAGPPRLAGLLLLLRAVLSAQRAGIAEILIVAGDDPTPLLHDKRVQVKWRWVPAYAKASAGGPAQLEGEVGALRAVSGELEEGFVLLFADSIFDPKALAELAAAPLDGKVIRAAAHQDAGGQDLAGTSLFLCSPEFIRLLRGQDASERIESVATSLIHAREPQGLEPGSIGGAVGTAPSTLLGTSKAVPSQSRPLDTVAVSGRLWKRTSDPEGLRRIQRELTHFNLKPSDGIFARFNKLVVAEALIRFFLHTPATPNFITGLGLFFGIWSGWAFAQGSYGWSIAGALLAYVSAMMDHCDGMVARLKFQESEFGVWFETAVDYASYVFIFLGMSIGLWRETGVAHHLAVGGLFLFGAVVSFIVQARQRQLASADNPADFPNRFHSKLERHSRNFFHWFSRRVYFLVRRAVLPYFILLFCLLDFRVLLLGLATFGANLVWLLTLYNNRLFRLPRAESRGSPPKAPAPAD